MNVGSSGIGTLIIENGGAVSDMYGYAGLGTGSTGMVTVTGPGSMWTNSGNLSIGFEGDGTLSVMDGGTVSSPVGYIGYFAGSDGTVTVTGAGSTWTNSSALYVGNSGTGSLTIEDGGMVSNTNGRIGPNTGSEGTVTVSGSGSTWTNSFSLVVGNYGTGSLTIEDGGAVSNTNGGVGDTSGGEGTVLVSGSGSTWTNSSFLIVGASGGTGTLTIEDGGAVSNSAGYVASSAGGEGTVLVSGSGSTWTNSSFLYVGANNGTGTVTIEDGGTVSNTIGDIGGTLGSGEVTVSGDGSTWTNSNILRVGLLNNGTGILTVQDGGAVSSDGGSIGNNAGAEGTVTVTGTGSTWTNTGTFAVGLSGSGTLTVEDGGIVSNTIGYVGYSSTGEGTVTVTGAGSTWTNSNTLYVGYSGTGSLTIEGGGMVSNSAALIGLLSGSDGTVTVSGSGSTWTNSGQLRVGNSGAADLSISDDGLVTALGTTDIAYNGTAVGTLNIGTAAGDAAAAPGTLDTPMVQFGAGSGTLVFNHTDVTGNYEFAPDIASDSGTASIDHHAGYTALTGDASGFTQTTTVYGGTLAVENMLGGPVNVMNGGTLGGSGQITGTITIGNGGVLEPGSSIGTLNVTGNVTQQTGSTFAVEVDDLGNGDLLDVTGSYAIQSDVTLDVRPENGTDDGSTYPPLTQYTIITASDGVTGTFDTVTEDFLFLDAVASYDANNVYLTLSQVYDFVDVAVTPNQMQIAGALDGLPTDNPIKEAMLYILDDATAQDAFDQLSGEAHASLKGALVENGQRTVDAVNDRLHNAFDDINGNSSVAAYGDTVDTAGGFWLTGTGDWMNTDATNNTHEMNSDLYGVVAGLDYRVGEAGRLGILGGYSRTDTSVDALASETNADSYTIGVYGGTDNGNAVLSLGALYSWHSIDSSRTVTNPVTERLSADYDARSYQFFAEAGYRATTDRLTVEPFAGVSYINLQTDAFSETGGIAALSSPSQTTSTTFTTLGLRSSIELSSTVRTRGMVGWRHAFGDVDPASTFTIAGSGPFTILGAPIAQDAAVVEAGLDIEAGENVTIGASYEGQYGDGAIANGFNARLLAEF